MPLALKRRTWEGGMGCVGQRWGTGEETIKHSAGLLLQDLSGLTASGIHFWFRCQTCN